MSRSQIHKPEAGIPSDSGVAFGFRTGRATLAAAAAFMNGPSAAFLAGFDESAGLAVAPEGGGLTGAIR